MFDRAIPSMLVALAALVVPTRAETIQLRDGALVTGKILADKKDQVVVDIGFTVVSVPRAEIVKISSETVSDGSGLFQITQNYYLYIYNPENNTQQICSGVVEN
jgi:ribosomal protein S1